MASKVLEVIDLHTHFFTDDGVLRAVDGVSFSLYEAQTLCLVGESGCGKSMTARSLLRLIDKPGRLVSGSIKYFRDNRIIDIAALSETDAELRRLRGGDIAMIFQEPMTSLSPVHTIGNQLIESLRLHLRLSNRECHNLAIELLEKVGLARAKAHLDSYPFELSGGMRQRVMIAIALAAKPRLLIADEPTTALDVTTQAMILDLLLDLQEEYGMAILFITHDLGVVAEIADEVAVMYLGKIVETGDVHTFFDAAKHPYSRALLEARPHLELQQVRLKAIEGTVPSGLEKPSGCYFHLRCRDRLMRYCAEEHPTLLKVSAHQSVSCFLYHEHQSPDIGENLND